MAKNIEKNTYSNKKILCCLDKHVLNKHILAKHSHTHATTTKNNLDLEYLSRTQKR